LIGKKSAALDLICVGAVTGVRGVKGDLRIKSFTAEPQNIACYGPLFDKTGNVVYELEVTGQAKGQLIGRIGGTQDRTAAEKLKGLQLFVSRDNLPATDDNEYYFSDLVGLNVEDTEGKDLGTVCAVENFGAGDVLEVVGVVNGGLMVPFTKETVPKVDIQNGIIVIDPPDGIFDPPDEDAKKNNSNQYATKDI
jgi:16S rRNA processing protein RimM